MAKKTANRLCKYEEVVNPNPENELPDLDYSGCKYLGYAGVKERGKTSQYFFKCYCGNTFKTEAINVIKRLNPMWVLSGKGNMERVVIFI